MDKLEIAKYIEANIINPTATHADIKKVCDDAISYNFASVCVNSLNTYACHKFLKGKNINTCSLVGFPFGATASAAKAFEAACAIEDGAEEIDMVIDIASAKYGDFNRVQNDIENVIDACDGRATVKVIIECDLLTEYEIKKVCEVAINAGADYIRTSTGFFSDENNLESVKLIKNIVADSIGIKAEGKIGSVDDVVALVDAGADRIGLSNYLCLFK